jgi:hypothetical protein
MAPNFSTRVKNQLRAVWKLFLSVRTRDWELDDYPVIIPEQEADPAYDGTRLKQYRYIASIVKWGLVGLGDSEQESLERKRRSLVPVRAFRLNSLLKNASAHIPNWLKTSFAVSSNWSARGFQMSQVCGTSIMTKRMTSCLPKSWKFTD